MKKLIKEHAEKKSELILRVKRADDLQKELGTAQRQLLAANKNLLDAEVMEISLLRHAWPPRDIDQAIWQVEQGEDARQANDCNPVDLGDELKQLRARVRETLKSIYSSPEVEETRLVTESLRQSVEKIKTLIKNIADEIEEVNSQIPLAKKELSEMERRIWVEVYEAARKDIQKTVFPSIRRAFVLVNGYNPYFWRWGDSQFFFHLFEGQKISIEDVLSEREQLRKEIFKS